MKCARAIPHSPPSSHQNYKSPESIGFTINAKYQKLLRIIPMAMLQKTLERYRLYLRDTQIDRFQKYAEIKFKSLLNLLMFVSLEPITWVTLLDLRGRKQGWGHPSFQAMSMKNTLRTSLCRMACRSFRRPSKSFYELLHQISGIPLDSKWWANWVPHSFS